MTLFRYTFGYCTPEQQALNDRHGWDDENSACVLVEADSAEAALEWGRAVAEAFVGRLFGAGVSWRAERFADWVEPESAPGPDEVILRPGGWPDWSRFP